MESNDNRLDRIEVKLDEMKEALVTLARIDERMISLFRRMDSYDESQRDLIKRVTDIENKSTGQSSKVDWIERVIWVCLVGAITIFFNMGMN